MARSPLPTQRLRSDYTVINLADDRTTHATGKGVAAHFTISRALQLETLIVPHLRDTLLSGAQVAKKFDF